MTAPKGIHLAQHLGITSGRVSQLKKQGMPVESFDAAMDWYRKNVDQKFSPKLVPGVAMPEVSKVAALINESYDLQSARAKRETHEANIAALKERQILGELVEAARVSRAVTTWAAMARAAFEKIPDKVSERVAAESDATQCHALLSAEIDLVLADLAAGARAMKFETDDGRA
jgi:phage terminase Nu1 subunit (DNA packaging protein)